MADRLTPKRKTIWDFPDTWPPGDSQRVFLGEAVQLVGKALMTADWTGEEPKLMADAEGYATIAQLADPAPPSPRPPFPAKKRTNKKGLPDLSKMNPVSTENAMLRAGIAATPEGKKQVIEALAKWDASNARLEEAMKWIATHGREKDRLATFYLNPDEAAPEFHWLKPQIWNKQQLWQSLFSDCSIRLSSGKRYKLYLDREALARCLTGKDVATPTTPEPPPAKSKGGNKVNLPNWHALNVLTMRMLVDAKLDGVKNPAQLREAVLAKWQKEDGKTPLKDSAIRKWSDLVFYQVIEYMNNNEHDAG